MDQYTRDIVMAEAADVRHWAEEQAARGHLDDLNGWCARASAELHRRLTRRGIPAEIHMWTWELDASAHVYVVVEDHVLDVTASQFKQFRHQRVVLLHVREAEAYEFYRSVDIFKCADSLRRQQKKDLWPQDQVALPG